MICIAAQADITDTEQVADDLNEWANVHNPPMDMDEVPPAPAAAMVAKGGRVGNAQVLSNIRNLKAYCLAAYDKAADLKNDHPSMSHSSLVHFIENFGKPFRKKKKSGVGNIAFGHLGLRIHKIDKKKHNSGDIIVHYASAMGKIGAAYKHGIGKYLLTHMNKAIVSSSKGAVMVHRTIGGAMVAQFNYRALGLRWEPAYFRKLAIALNLYSRAQVKVVAATKGAGAAAAVNWFLKGAKNKYRSFFARIKAKVKANAERLMKQVIKGAKKSEVSAWKQHKRVTPEAPAGLKGANSVFRKLGKKMKLPSVKEMRKAAKKLADNWLKRQKDRSMAHKVKKIVKKAKKKESKKLNCPKPSAKKVKGYRVVACGDCDEKYTAPFKKKLVGLKRCADYCTKHGCKRFSYGTRTSTGKFGVGCRISQGKKACPLTVKRYCAKGYKIGKGWPKGTSKDCCKKGACSKINFWGGHAYEPVYAVKKAVKKAASHCSGTGWCETFHTCAKGDKRNFWAFVKAKGYKQFKGACAAPSGRYGKRHKYWAGKFSFSQCKAKCDKLGKVCQGITMPTTIKCKGAAKSKPAPKKKAAAKCKGTSWCETFHTCVKGDGRKFHAYVKAKGYKMFKGACASSSGKYGKRHKYWAGKFTYDQCKKKCDGMGKKCEGITMTTAIKCSGAGAKPAKKKAVLTCSTTTKGSNKAGIVKTHTAGGYTMVGGGMVNHYRTWNKLAGFEEAHPDGNHFRCDTGFGPGRLTCYGRSCKTNVGALKCVTKTKRFKGSGVRDAHLPKGYVMTGGGLNNHYRGWNKRAGFEETRPNGNSWRGDMGFGWGDYTVYVRGCKAPAGRKLTCVTKHSKRGNYNKVTCPAGFTVTGCGVNNHYRHWNKKSGYESHFPHGNNQCHCDTAFGSGDNTCYARCCKLE